MCDSDSKFVAIKDAWCVGSPIENIGSNQHNSKVEVEIKILKERMRCMMARVGWKVTGMLIESLVIAAATIHNILPRVNEIVGARQKLTGKYADYNQMKYSWGQYGQGYVRSAQINNDNFRSQGVLVLYPKFNESGSYVGVNLNTRRFVIVSQFIPSPTPDSVIDYMNNWFFEELAEDNMKLCKSSERLLEKEMANERKHRKRIKNDQSVADKVIDNNLYINSPIVEEDECYDTSLNPKKLSKECTSNEIDGSTHCDERFTDNINNYSGNGDNSQNDNNGESNCQINESVEIVEDSFQSRGDNTEDEVPLAQNLIGNKRPNRARNRPGRYVFNVLDFSNIQEDDNEQDLPSCDDKDNNNNNVHETNVTNSKQYGDNMNNRIFYDRNLDDIQNIDEEIYRFSFLSKIKSALEDGGDLVEEAIRKEFKQLIDKSVWKYINVKDVSSGMSPRPINSLLNVDKKFDAQGNFLKWKARFCACGNHQDCSSLVVT